MYVANPLTKAALTNILKSETFEGVKIEHSDIWGVGLLTVSCTKGASTTDIPFKIEFSKDLKTLLHLPQTIYSGTLNPASKTRVNITLRAKDKIPKWPDVRTTLPYIWTVSAEEPYLYHQELFEKDKEALQYYLKEPMYKIKDGVTIYEYSP